MGDAVNNASGLGFNGYDDDGNAKWDLLTNVKIFQLEVIIVNYSCISLEILSFTNLIEFRQEQALNQFLIIGIFRLNFGSVVLLMTVYRLERR